MIDSELYNYRWVIVILAAVANALTWGIVYSVGIYYVRWNDYFIAGKGDIAIIGGLNSGTASLLAPVFGLLVRRFGLRLSGVIGGLLLAFGLVGSAFSSSIPLLCVFYGIVVGSGVGLGYFCASVSVNNYFKRHRALADSISTTGSAMGGFLFSILGQYLTSEYGWQGALMITAAISAHVIITFQLSFTPSYLAQFPLLSNWKSRNKQSDVHEMKRMDFDDDEGEKKTPLGDDTQGQTWLRQCFALLCDPVFLLILTADLLCWIGIYVPFIHLPERARLLGMDMETIGWLASLLSLSNLIGRPILGSLPSFFKIDPFYLYGFINGLAGLLTIFSVFLKTKEGLLSYAAAYGFMNTCVPLVRTSLSNLLGTKTFPLAYSWVVFFNGLALFIGPAVAGSLYDISSSYDCSFYATGSVLLLSGLLTALKNPAIRLKQRIANSSKSSPTLI